MKISKLICQSCDTEVVGTFTLPLLMQLNIDEQESVLNFLKYSGRLKEMAKEMGKSCPTVRHILDELIYKLNSLSDEH